MAVSKAATASMSLVRVAVGLEEGRGEGAREDAGEEAADWAGEGAGDWMLVRMDLCPLGWMPSTTRANIADVDPGGLGTVRSTD